MRAAAFATLGLLCAAAVFGQSPPSPTTNPQGFADAIAKQVAEIRGLPFKQNVRVETQSTAEFNEYVSHRLDEEMPDTIRRNYGTIARVLGLYRGPAIDDFSDMMTAVMTSQVAAYYDPEKQKFFIVMSGMPDLMLGVLYAHELYHALQDQHFDVASYLGMKPGQAPPAIMNSDAELARQSVVEGEATYMMSLWMMQKMMGKVPERDVMTQVVTMQANMSVAQMRKALENPEVAKLLGPDLQDSVAAAGDIPPFIIDTMIGAYFKGLSFVFAVQEKGWPAVEKLYSEYPPRSTEHILHPEKWLARENPVDFPWPDFAKVKALKGWELLTSDVLGEFQWRIVFNEHGLANESHEIAAGWGGDRYAVFKEKDSDATLLLWRTAWDSEAEAADFAEAYDKVLAVKYGEMKTPPPTHIVLKGVNVFIVEGGEQKNLGALMKVVSSL
jgi:hypothetical protein